MCLTTRNTYCTVQFDFKQKLFVEITARKRGREESKWAKAERDKAQRGSLSAANTDTVMHQDLAPCLHHSSECSILYMETHCSVSALNQSRHLSLSLYCKNIQQLQSGRKDKHSCLNPRGTCVFPKCPPGSYIFCRTHSQLQPCWNVHFLLQETNIRQTEIMSMLKSQNLQYIKLDIFPGGAQVLLPHSVSVWVVLKCNIKQ